ncbi:methylated-DNA--[protein]-cysteine S-methyltransferase [Modestobacter lapidis]|nr:methylated-DNA--[protein]-cysteine S-methyltransferase [Modestobacter lapidis]
MDALTRNHRVIDSPLGPLTLVGEAGVLTGVWFDRHTRRPGAATLGQHDAAALEDAATQLDEYFAGHRSTFDLAVSPAGTDFEQSVRRLVSEIPYGETRSYGQLAGELGDPALAQAVGAANGRNPVCIVIPCHRVIGADGRLVGYVGGLDRKRDLLDRESRWSGRALC